jgi:hypothetical protein
MWGVERAGEDEQQIPLRGMTERKARALQEQILRSAQKDKATVEQITGRLTGRRVAMRKFRVIAFSVSSIGTSFPHSESSKGTGANAKQL